MGFYSTLCSGQRTGQLPDWFKSKYSNIFLFPYGVMIASKCEAKLHRNEIYEDYQKALAESGFWDNNHHEWMNLAILAEDGMVSKVIITKEKIKYNWQENIDDENECVWDGI